MKFRRKATPVETTPAAAEVAESSESTEVAESVPAAAREGGPYDVSELSDDIDRVDIGALLVAPMEGMDLRLQVNEKTEEVGSALLAGSDGAMELLAYSAPASGGLWDEVRPQIAADVKARGGDFMERQGPFGTELICRVPAKMPDGTEGVQPSRIIGIEGKRWFLRATMLGRPAMEIEESKVWEHALSLVAVRRGDHAMPVGKQLPLVLPADARRV